MEIKLSFKVGVRIHETLRYIYVFSDHQGIS